MTAFFLVMLSKRLGLNLRMGAVSAKAAGVPSLLSRQALQTMISRLVSNSIFIFIECLSIADSTEGTVIDEVVSDLVV